jgi:hypothetical protein
MMHHILGTILVGAVFGSAAKSKLRPVLRKAVKGGLIVQRKAEQLGRNVRAGANELVAEARADLDRESPGGTH